MGLFPNWLPIYRSGGLIRRLAWAWLLRRVARFIRKQDFKNVVLWTYQADVVEILGRLREQAVVYDCVDEFSVIPYYRSRPASQARLAAMEAELIRRADVVTTTSQSLYESKSRIRADNVHLVENVGDFEHFHRAAAPGPVPEDLAAIPGPRIGFFGAVSDYKMDFGLLAETARRFPDVQIVLIGPVGEGDRATRTDLLHGLPNVHILGLRDYAVLPDYIRGFDVCIIPYRDNAYVRGVFPIKFFECLATGKPLVTTNMATLARYRDLFYLSETTDAFFAQLTAALAENDPGRVQARISAARVNDWGKRLAEIVRLVQTRLK